MHSGGVRSESGPGPEHWNFDASEPHSPLGPRIDAEIFRLVGLQFAMLAPICGFSDFLEKNRSGFKSLPRIARGRGPGAAHRRRKVWNHLVFDFPKKEPGQNSNPRAVKEIKWCRRTGGCHGSGIERGSAEDCRWRGYQMVEAEAGAGAFCTVMGGRGFADLPTYIHYEQLRLKEFPDAQKAAMGNKINDRTSIPTKPRSKLRQEIHLAVLEQWNEYLTKAQAGRKKGRKTYRHRRMGQRTNHLCCRYFSDNTSSGCGCQDAKIDRMWAKITVCFHENPVVGIRKQGGIQATASKKRPQDGCVRDPEHRKRFQETDRQEDLEKFWQLSAGYTKKKVQGTQRGGPKKETNTYVPRNETRCRIESIRGEGRTKTQNVLGEIWHATREEHDAAYLDIALNPPDGTY
ncbi:hypothetical protein B0H14DRAFT_2637504 [Mycena olivaceomarginata]|nr:hypothetical protein B0H14DRAFT_2637504 [Mycena olivaceomarginata]